MRYIQLTRDEIIKENHHWTDSNSVRIKGFE